jgi:hypothetical protein
VEQENQTAAAAASVDHAAHAGLLDDLMARIAPCFARRETRLTCRDMVNGLLSELEDHNCWTLAEAAGHASPYQMQHLLSRARCDERQMLDAAADWAAATSTDGARQVRQSKSGGRPRRALASGRRGRRFKSGHPDPGQELCGLRPISW